MKKENTMKKLTPWMAALTLALSTFSVSAEEGFEAMRSGNSGKVVLDWNA